MALDFFAGCLGGCAGVLVGHPFDTVKVHLQTQDVRNPVYRGTFDCLKSIIIKDSVRGLYRGMSSPIAGVAFVNAIVFGVYGNVQRRMDDPDSLKSHFLAGSFAGLAQSIICSPMELAKTRLQIQSNLHSNKIYKGPIDCLLKIKKQHGIRGVFKGLTITAVRDIPGFSSYFVSYELMMKYMQPNTFNTLMAGGLAGTFSWIISYPIDIVKSRLQADGMSGTPKYNNAYDCFLTSYKNEGPTFLMRGLSSTIIRAFPMNAACFYVVSWVLKFNEKKIISVDKPKSEQQKNINKSTLQSPSLSSSTPSYSLFTQFHHPHVRVYRLNHNIKSLVFLNALFSDSICPSEILDMASDRLDSEIDFVQSETFCINEN